MGTVRISLVLVLGLVLASAVGAMVGCTDGVREAGAPARHDPAQQEPARNSDGSLQVLPPGPPSRPPHTLVLAYDDFGPQALAHELLGMGWWQWEAGGSWEPGDRFDVRVVVYRGISRAAVEAEYPTIEGRADHRHVTYDDAIAYLERAMAEIEGEPSLASLRSQLAVTRARLRQQLGATRLP
jgi:hypothetical protein